MTVQWGTRIEGLLLGGRWGGFGPYLPLESGLTVLFGLNGAGKTRILSALVEGLTGLCDANRGEAGAMLHVRGSLTSRRRSMWAGYPGDELGGVPDGVDGASLLQQVLEQEYLLVCATGTRAPAWEGHPAAVRMQGQPDLEFVMDLLDKGVTRLPDEDDSDSPFSSLTSQLVVQVAVPGRLGTRGTRIERPTLYWMPPWVGEHVLFDSAPASRWERGDNRTLILGLGGYDPDEETRHQLAAIGEDFSPWQYGKAHAAPMEEFDTAFERDLALAARGHTEGLRSAPLSEWIIASPSVDEDGASRESSGHLTDDSGMAWVAGFLSARVNALYGRLLMDAPLLRLATGRPADWAAGRVPSWGGGRGTWVPLNQLSEAEQRWAAIAVQLALMPEPGGFLIVDEPERGLHRFAEAHLARGLAEIAAEKDLTVVAATHSPDLLDVDGAHVFLVQREDQRVQGSAWVVPIDDVARQELRQYGFRPIDLLGRHRGYLVVEGEHEVIILRELLGDDLDAMGVEVMSMRGARNIATVPDAYFLFDHTNAHVFVLLDALRSHDVRPAWAEAVRRHAEGDGTAGAFFTEQMQLLKKAKKVEEAGFLGSFGRRAIDRGRSDRLSPLTLSLPDILWYLDADALVPGGTSWEALQAELDASAGAPQSGTKFKTWLTNKKDADFSEESITRACKSLDHIPEDFSALLDQMRDILRAR